MGQTGSGVDLAMVAKVHQFAEDFEFTDIEAKRVEGQSLGELAWSMKSLPDSTRAQAAFVVSQALIKVLKRDEAKTWLERAVSLKSNPTWQQILESY